MSSIIDQMVPLSTSPLESETILEGLDLDENEFLQIIQSLEQEEGVPFQIPHNILSNIDDHFYYKTDHPGDLIRQDEMGNSFFYGYIENFRDPHEYDVVTQEFTEKNHIYCNVRDINTNTIIYSLCVTKEDYFIAINYFEGMKSEVAIFCQRFVKEKQKYVLKSYRRTFKGSRLEIQYPYEKEATTFTLTPSYEIDCIYFVNLQRMSASENENQKCYYIPIANTLSIRLNNSIC